MNEKETDIEMLLFKEQAFYIVSLGFIQSFSSNIYVYI